MVSRDQGPAAETGGYVLDLHLDIVDDVEDEGPRQQRAGIHNWDFRLDIVDVRR